MHRLSVAVCGIAALIFGGVFAAGFAADNGGAVAGMAESSTGQLHPADGMSGVVIPAPVNMSADPSQHALVARGQYLTIAADCYSCHTVSGQPLFSGGYPVDTPVGTIYGPNITSSKRYGIGNWTDAQFYSVLHDGIRPGHSLLIFPSYLFPVMPYTSYSKLTYQDVMAIKAYLDAIPPVENPNRPMAVGFPFNVRAGQLAWRILFFHHAPLQYEPNWNASVRNGAYLAQALGHCSECHTPRNLLMASITSQYFAGGHIISQSWYAPNISSSKQYGLGGWDDPSLLQYLRGGGDMSRGAPFGPMQEVVDDSLSRLPKSDVQDLVAYLRTVPPQETPSSTASDAASPAEGAAIFADNCARCHGANGAGVSNNFPNLAHNEALSEGLPDNAISMVLGGFQPWHPNQSAMPGFGIVLSSEQIAAVTNYIRTSWGNTGTSNATGDMVERLRASTNQEVSLDDGNMHAVLHDANSVHSLQVIGGSFELEGNRTNCQLAADLALANNGGTMHLAGSCADHGFTVRGDVTANGETTPVILTLGDITTGNYPSGVTLDGPLGANNYISARISFVTPNE